MMLDEGFNLENAELFLIFMNSIGKEIDGSDGNGTFRMSIMLQT